MSQIPMNSYGFLIHCQKSVMMVMVAMMAMMVMMVMMAMMVMMVVIVMVAVIAMIVMMAVMVIMEVRLLMVRIAQQVCKYAHNETRRERGNTTGTTC